jgi:hypothetical protein
MSALLAMLLASSVDVELTVRKPLYLVRGELRGAIEVRVKNAGPDPVTLRHRDVHGLRFASASGEAAVQTVFHSCDCLFELGMDQPPKARTFTLAPGESRTLKFDAFTCDGGPYRAPAEGRYLLSYSLHEPDGAPAKRDPFELKQCEALARERPPGPFQAAPVPVDLKARRK